MDFELAKRVLNIITDRYLFSNATLLTVGGSSNYGEPEQEVDDYLLFAFDFIDGIGIGSEHSQNDYYIELYQTTPSEIPLYRNRIARAMEIADEDLNIVETNPFHFHHLRANPFTEEVIPLRMGISVGHIASKFYGTLGCFVEYKDNTEFKGQRFLLSNYHILVSQESYRGDDFIIHPGNPNGNRNNIVGRLFNKLPYDVTGENEFDAALAGPVAHIDTSVILPAMERNLIDVFLDFVGSSSKEAKAFQPHITQVAAPIINEKVYKIGATSGLTLGKVRSILTNVKVMDGETKIPFRNQLLLKGNRFLFAHSLFSQPGDSGALVLNSQNQGIGLLFAGNSDFSLANSLEKVLSELGVVLCST